MSTGGNANSPRPVSFANDIVPLFSPTDIACMTGMGVFLDDYTFMSNPDNAKNVLDHLTGDSQPQMPLGGPYWPDAQIALFRTWMTETPPYQP